MDQTRDVESRDPYRPNWSVTTSHKSEKDVDDGSLLSPLVDDRYRDERCSASMERDEADVEAQVREALRLLEDDGDGGSEEEQEHEQWTTRASAETYWEGVNEVMEDKWVTDDQEEQVMAHWGSMDRSVGSKEEEDEVEEEEERNERHDDDDNVVQIDAETRIEEEKGRQSAQNDEWQEAYTAKGRVYYYNRCTRESFWKKPSQFDASTSQPQMAAAEAEETTERHPVVLGQHSEDHALTAVSAVPSMEHQVTLFCCFCGEQQVSDQYAAHFQECATANFHKRRLSPLYASFERALVLMSEDTTLRSMHYAASFPDPTPYEQPQATSMRDSLLLLHSRRRRSITQQHSTEGSTLQRRSSTRESMLGTASDGLKDPLDDQRVHREPKASLAVQPASVWQSKQKMKREVRKQNSQPTSSVFGGVPVTQQKETCRYCNRSFAEGRLAKHEAVCPRVFGNEGSWGRGTSSNQVSPPSRRSASVEILSKPAGLMASSSHKQKDHTLQHSYIEHKATLVLCPCCRRKFAPSGAQQHIAICKGVQNRPKNSIPLRHDYTIAG
ncbi:unnamed protein product [Hyaloperonospora brassicae]|uniref:WW domain-containing protein n=1 Tax=Hyaloperonospora brassicae TaxID=162125 RepID=A0AAV0TST6_HYABA|nr:unnamed protein product [Hyaloperonospora brassicae]